MSTPTPYEPSSSTTATRSRALVLGGGGSTGNAWLIGVVAGLHAAGVDVRTADLTVGTSAGATAAVQLAGADPADLFAAALVDPTGPVRPPAPPGPGAPVVNHLNRLTGIIASATDAADMRRRVGTAALEMESASDGSWPARWRSTVAARLPRTSWPDRPLLLTAVDARTGVPVVLDRHSGVELVDAVAASCSSSLPYPVGDARYVDGGYRRNENADLALGYARVLVLSPLGGRTLHPTDWGMQLATQIDELRASGSEVETVCPTADSEHLFGAHAMDLSLRPAAARAGYELGGTLADPLGRFWR